MTDILIFAPDDQPVEVRLQGDTVWLTQRQMSEVFGTTPENVLMHLKKIFAEGELDEAATAQDFLAVRQEGTRQVKRRRIRAGGEPAGANAGPAIPRDRRRAGGVAGDRCRHAGFLT